MSVDILDGPLGLEARLVLPNRAAYTMNDRSVAARSAARVIFDAIGNWGALGDREDRRSPRRGMIGEQALRAILLGKTLSPKGRVQAPSRQLLVRAVREFQAAMNDDQEQRFELWPHPDYGSIGHYFHAATLALDGLDDDQTNYSPQSLPTPWQRDFTLSIRLSDPRMYVIDDLAGTGFTSGSTHTLDVGGNAPTDPVISGTLDGVDHFTVENLSLPVGGAHAKLFFDDLPVTTGDVEIDFDSRVATIDGDDIGGFLTGFDSRWWDDDVPAGMNPGSNQIKATGLDDWGVAWHDAFWA
jgi:hypothetical protein